LSEEPQYPHEHGSQLIFMSMGGPPGPSKLKTTRESAVAGYRGLLRPFKIRRMGAIVFQFRVEAGVP